MCVHVRVCALLTVVTVEGCRVSRGMVMNGSVVTSQVQLPLCCLFTLRVPLLYRKWRMFSVSAQPAGGRGRVVC